MFARRGILYGLSRLDGARPRYDAAVGGAGMVNADERAAALDHSMGDG